MRQLVRAQPVRHPVQVAAPLVLWHARRVGRDGRLHVQRPRVPEFVDHLIRQPNLVRVFHPLVVRAVSGAQKLPSLVHVFEEPVEARPLELRVFGPHSLELLFALALLQLVPRRLKRRVSRVRLVLELVQLNLESLALLELELRRMPRSAQVRQQSPQLEDAFAHLRRQRRRRIFTGVLRGLEQLPLLLNHALDVGVFTLPVRSQRIVQLLDANPEERPLLVLHRVKVSLFKSLLAVLHVLDVRLPQRLHELVPVLPQHPGRHEFTALPHRDRLLLQLGYEPLDQLAALVRVDVAVPVLVEPSQHRFGIFQAEDVDVQVRVDVGELAVVQPAVAVGVGSREHFPQVLHGLHLELHALARLHRQVAVGGAQGGAGLLHGIVRVQLQLGRHLSRDGHGRHRGCVYVSPRVPPRGPRG
mmetsp:Transcript_2386/g.10565  ORF Transcript_2386/g.10565 Transcript_2386/m.10565 type:complete len:415 (-) Transcript_2386:64-1308(-)